MRLAHRAQLEALPGGRWIVDALEQIVTAISVSPLAAGNAQIFSGTGAPENRLRGNVGDIFLRTDGSTTTTLYVKESGNNSLTGWIAK